MEFRIWPSRLLRRKPGATMCWSPAREANLFLLILRFFMLMVLYQPIHRSIALWEKGNVSATIHFNSSKDIRKITLGNPHVPDANKSDNVFEMK